MKGEKPKKRYINLLLFAGVLLLTLLASEITVRLVWSRYNPLGREMGGIVHNDTLGWTGKPGSTTVQDEPGRKYIVSHNRWGFRDSEWLREEEIKGKTKILFIGNSYTAGNGIAQDSRVSEIITKLDTTFISYNLGMAGFSTDQELLTLRKFGPMIKPRVVVLFFCFNDIIFNKTKFLRAVPKPHFIVNADGSLTLENVPVPQMPKRNPVWQWIKKHSALTQLIVTVMERRAFEEQVKQQTPTSRQGISAEKDITYYLLKAILDECEHLEAQLILFNTPSNRDATKKSPATPRGIQQIMRWCSELGITAVDLFPVFHRDFTEHGEDLYIWDCMHWNERGHRLVAQELLKMLKSEEGLKSHD